METELLILAGGFGTRLQSVLNGKPKPLANINGVPFIKFLFQNWLDQGVSNFILSLHFEAKLIIDFIQNDELLKKCNIQFVIEPEPLGTGGAVAYAVDKLNMCNEFLIANADTWLGSGINEILRVEGNAIAAVEIESANRYGLINLNEAGKITDFLEKNENSNSGLINAGLYKLLRNNFDNWDGLPYSLEKELFPNLVKTHSLSAILLATDFIDIGVPDDYFKFCEIKKNSK